MINDLSLTSRQQCDQRGKRETYTIIIWACLHYLYFLPVARCCTSFSHACFVAILGNPLLASFKLEFSGLIVTIHVTGLIRDSQRLTMTNHHTHLTYRRMVCAFTDIKHLSIRRSRALSAAVLVGTISDKAEEATIT